MLCLDFYIWCQNSIDHKQFFKLLKGIARGSWHKRQLLINLGVIRSIVAFYLNDTPILHFNRQVVGRNDQGQRQTRRIAPPRVHDVLKLLSVLVRSASTATFPPEPKKVKRDNNQAQMPTTSATNELPDDLADLPDEPDEEPPDLPPEPTDNTDGPKDTDTTTKIEVEESVSIRRNAVLNTGNETKEDNEPIDLYYDQEFEEKGLEYGFPPYFTRLNDGRGRGILLPDDDKRCIWNGLDFTLGKNIQECEPWDVPSTIDPLPSYSEYNRFVEQQQALTGYRKKHGKENKNYHQIYK